MKKFMPILKTAGVVLGVLVVVKFVVPEKFKSYVRI